MQNMPNVSARVLNLAFAVADAQAVVVAVVVALVLAVCFAFGARWITAQGERIGGPRGRIHAQGASILSMGISMVQVALLESRFRGDSLHSGAWCLRLAAQAAGIRT